MKKKILVCDDDELTREIISQSLQQLGYEVSTFSDGAEAQRAVEVGEFDLIVMDILMPKMSGLEFVTWLRSVESRAITPVLLVTALTDVEYRVRGLEGGADDYLTKPFQLRELEARVRALLRGRELALELRQKNDELQRLQEELVIRERALSALQVAGTAAHAIRQPLTTLQLSCFQIKQSLEKISDQNKSLFLDDVNRICSEVEKIDRILERLHAVDASRTAPYVGELALLELPEDAEEK